MASASSRRLAYRVAATAALAAGLGARSVGIAAATTSSSSTAAHTTAKTSSSSSEPKSSPSSKARYGSGSARAHHCPNMGSKAPGTSHNASPGTS